MNDMEFMSYISGLVDVCFSEKDIPNKYFLNYCTVSNPQSWIIDQVDNIFEDHVLVDPTGLFDSNEIPHD